MTQLCLNLKSSFLGNPLCTGLAEMIHFFMIWMVWPHRFSSREADNYTEFCVSLKWSVSRVHNRLHFQKKIPKFAKHLWRNNNNRCSATDLANNWRTFGQKEKGKQLQTSIVVCDAIKNVTIVTDPYKMAVGSSELIEYQKNHSF